MNQIISVVLIVAGLSLIAMSSVILTPYQTLQTSAEYKGYNISRSALCLSSNESLGLDNGSSAVIELAPNSSKLFIAYHLGGGTNINRSLIQIVVFLTDGEVLFSLLGINSADGSVSAHYLFYAVGLNTPPFYWTPNFDAQDGVGFLFENPDNETVQFQAALTSYKNTVTTQEVTKYQTLLDSRYIYIGMLLVGLAAVTDLSLYWRKSKAERPSQ